MEKLGVISSRANNEYLSFQLDEQEITSAISDFYSRQPLAAGVVTSLACRCPLESRICPISGSTVLELAIGSWTVVVAGRNPDAIDEALDYFLRVPK